MPKKEAHISDARMICLPKILLAGCFFGGVYLLFLNPTLWRFFIGPYFYGEPPLYPFLDMHGRLAAFEATRLGIDILHLPNPIDPMHRMSVKPTWPLALSFLGLGPQHLALVGFTTITVFMGIVVSILQPRYWGQSIVCLFLCFSPPVLLGIERANDDLIYFCLIALVPLLLKRKSRSSLWFCWLVIFLLAPAKYYPGAVFLVLVAEVKDWRQLGLLFGAGVGFVSVYVATHLDEILYLQQNVPKPDLYLVHGGVLPFTLLDLPRLLFPVSVALVGVVFLMPLVLSKWPQLDSFDCSERRWFLLGFSVFSFCFFLNSNYDYRLIYVIPMLPLLFNLYREPGWWRWASVYIITSVVVVFWLDIFSVHSSRVLLGQIDAELLKWSTFVKSVLLWPVSLLLVLLAATLLRPNLRRITLRR